MSRLYCLNLRPIGLKFWIFYYWPIFWLVSFFSLHSLRLAGTFIHLEHQVQKLQNFLRSRSTSPGKTVTFAGPSIELDQDERSLNELDSTPRRMIHLKPLALAASNLIAVSKGHAVKAAGSASAAKRRAPSPPISDEDTNNNSIKGLSNEVSMTLRDSEEDSEEDFEENEAGSHHEGHHEALGAKLSASLRQTFHLK